MAKQVINIGTNANDGTGDPIRDAFDKVNDNFTELYTDDAGDVNSITATAPIVRDSPTGAVTISLADAGVTLAKVQNVAANSILVRDANSSGVLTEKALATTQILIGDGTGMTAAALSGDATMTNAGVVSIGANKIITDKILDLNVTTSKIADDAVTTDKLANSINTTITDLQTDKYDKAGGTISGDAAITGNLIVDTNTLYVDSSTNNVAINDSTNANISLTVTSKSGYEDIAYFKSSGTNIDARINLFPTGTGNSVINSASNSLELQTAGSPKMTINSSGNVGIGSVTPSGKFEVNTGTQFAYFTRTAGDNGSINPALAIAADASSTRLYSYGTGMTFWTAAVGGTAAERMRIDSSGNVGIGTTNPSTPLQVNGVAQIVTGSDTAFYEGDGVRMFGTQWYRFRNSGGNVRALINVTTGNLSLYNSSNVLTNLIATDGNSYFNGGNVGIGTTSPAYTLHLLKSSGDTEIYINGQNGESSLRMGLDSRNWQIKTAAAPYLWSLNYVGTDAPLSNIITANVAGNVGIGTASPTSLLHLESASSPSLKIKDTTQGATLLAFSQNADSHIGTYSNHPLIFDANSTERLRITSAGDVLIGTTTAIGSASEILQIKNDNGEHKGIAVGNSDGALNTTAIAFYNSNGAVGAIRTSGSATSYATSSDYRLKENVVPMEGALDRVDALKPSRFNFIADADKTVDGFLAHEVAEIIPEAISGEKDAVDKEGNAIYQGIDQSKLVPLLVGAIQELKAEIETLKSQIQ